MQKLTKEEKNENTERYKAVRRGEIKPEYKGIPERFKEEKMQLDIKEEDNHSIGYLYSKALYLAGYKPKKSEYFKDTINSEEIKNELIVLSSQKKINRS